MILNIHSVLKSSFVNGPGKRAVIWTQGCSLNCKGCFNPDTHPFDKKPVDAKELAIKLSRLDMDGITISGGEPLDQSESILAFIEEYKKNSKGTILLFTGYHFKEIEKDYNKLNVIRTVDAVLAGRYKPGLVWCNKELLIITGKIKAEELKPLTSVELNINLNEVIVTGYPIVK